MKTKTERPRRKMPSVSVAALDETLRLYSGWLALLLKRLGEADIRVEEAELRHALETFSCRVEKEGSVYVLHMEGTPLSVKGNTDERADTESDAD